MVGAAAVSPVPPPSVPPQPPAGPLYSIEPAPVRFTPAPRRSDDGPGAMIVKVVVGVAAAAIGLTVIGVILTPQILRWMGTPDDVLVNSIAYFRMYFIGSIAVVMYNVGASILQSVGDSKSPMRYLIAASLINIVLDLVFVMVFHWGIAGAVVATTPVLIAVARSNQPETFFVLALALTA